MWLSFRWFGLVVCVVDFGWLVYEWVVCTLLVCGLHGLSNCLISCGF